MPMYYDPKLKEPAVKYKAFQPVPLENRQWPSKTITKAPRWLSTDLRDGNQSLARPMDVNQKIDFFNLLVDIGYKEIEISFPCASDTEWEFTRYLVETPDAVPDDVWLQVMSPCREDLIPRTVEAARGAKNAIIHIYVATSPEFLDKVYSMTEDETMDLAVRCATIATNLTKNYDQPCETNWTMQFSMEAFQDTRPEFAVKICEAVKAIWKPTVENPIIFTLAATVESSTPNLFADLVEYFSLHMTEREKVCVSVHPHNDRGTAVAAAEQAQLAGGNRIEGCLFGNGERTGNVDLVTLALNLYTQGISPNVDFSELEKIANFVEDIIHIPPHPRAPYIGRFAYCTFAGSHQDAIKKGFNLRNKDENGVETSAKAWDIPYIPIDPGDLSRAHEPLVRITSQSGKGGGAFILQERLGIDLPRSLQIDFARTMKVRATGTCAELSEDEVVTLFNDQYVKPKCNTSSDHAPMLLECNIKKDTSVAKVTSPVKKLRCMPTTQKFTATFALDSDPDSPKHVTVCGHGVDTISAIVSGLSELGIRISVRETKHQDMAPKRKTRQNGHEINGTARLRFVSFVEATMDGRSFRWGVAMHDIRLHAIVLATCNAANNLKRPKSA